MKKLKHVLIWDLPTRLFHWIFAGGVFMSVFLALVLDDDSPLFPYHAIVGLALSLMVILRIIWGFVGSKYSRFSSFAFGPRAVIDYIISALRGSGVRHAGHNPGAAWAIFAMLALVLGLAVTGVFMGQGDGSIEEIHELLAYTMITVVVLHILGVLLHTVHHRENITLSMVHGRKDVDTQIGIVSSHPLVALVFCVLCLSWGFSLFANYDSVKRTTRLPLIGFSIQVGEVEDDHSANGAVNHDNDDNDDD